MAELPDFDAMFEEIAVTREPELVLLKGHLFVERVLAWAVSIRLRSPGDRVKLKYPALAELAIRDEQARQPVLLLNELRNALAHEFRALDSAIFAKLIAKFELPWPNGALERTVVLHLIVQDAYYRTIRGMINEVHQDSSPVFDEYFDEDAFPRYAKRVEINANIQRLCRDLINANNGDGLIDEFRPGWKKPLRSA